MHNASKRSLCQADYAADEVLESHEFRAAGNAAHSLSWRLQARMEAEISGIQARQSVVQLQLNSQAEILDAVIRRRIIRYKRTNAPSDCED